MSLLHHSARLGKTHFVQYYLEHDMDVNIRDSNGRYASSPFKLADFHRTPLLLAIKAKSSETVRILLDVNANMSIKDNQGLFYLDYVDFQDFDQSIWELLQAQKAKFGSTTNLASRRASIARSQNLVIDAVSLVIIVRDLINVDQANDGFGYFYSEYSSGYSLFLCCRQVESNGEFTL